jgi:hypothetical protein
MRQGAEIDAEIPHHLGHVGLHSGACHGQGVAGENRIGVANGRSAFAGLGGAGFGMEWGVAALMPPTYGSQEVDRAKHRGLQLERQSQSLSDRNWRS